MKTDVQDYLLNESICLSTFSCSYIFSMITSQLSKQFSTYFMLDDTSRLQHWRQGKNSRVSGAQGNFSDNSPS